MRNEKEYPLDYFDPYHAQFNLSWEERGYKYLRKEMLWNGESLEEVDIVRIVDELIAYSVTRKTRKETLADAMEIHDSLNATAYRIISKSSQKVFDDIDRHGFFNIEGAPLIKELENDPVYRKALADK